MIAAAFDLGDTLIEYEGVPLSWEAHYPDALAILASSFGRTISDHQIAAGSAVLRRYNTRLAPRIKEVPFFDILKELSEVLSFNTPLTESSAAAAFFSVFQQRLRVFPDAASTQRGLRDRGLKTAVFTDVPYGMPRELLERDLAQTGLLDAIDRLITSRDVGFRKPSPLTLAAIAGALSSTPGQLTYLGNERKDIDASRAFGCRSVLIDRENRRPDWDQDHTISTLAQLLDLSW